MEWEGRDTHLDLSARNCGTTLQGHAQIMPSERMNPSTPSRGVGIDGPLWDVRKDTGRWGSNDSGSDIPDCRALASCSEVP